MSFLHVHRRRLLVASSIGGWEWERCKCGAERISQRPFAGRRPAPADWPWPRDRRWRPAAVLAQITGLGDHNEADGLPRDYWPGMTQEEWRTDD